MHRSKQKPDEVEAKNATDRDIGSEMPQSDHPGYVSEELRGELYRLAAESSRQGILLVQADAILYANPYALECLGYGEEELKSLPFSELVHPADRLRFSSSHHSISYADSRESAREFRLLHRNGDLNWVRCSLSNVPWEGRPALLGSLDDITELIRAQNELRKYRDLLEELVEERTVDLTRAIRDLEREIEERVQVEHALRESESRFRNLVEDSPVDILIVRDNRIAYRNLKLPVLKDAVEDGGHLPEFFRVVHPKDLEAVRSFMASLEAGEGSSEGVECRMMSGPEEDSEMRWVQCRGSRIEYQGLPALLLNLVDVTRTKELEYLVRIRDKMSALGRVAAGIAHEIRNPLSTINVYLSTLRRILEQVEVGEHERLEDCRRVIAEIGSASDRIESVIKKVMDFSKPGSPQLVSTDINGTVRETIQLSESALRKMGIRLETSLAADLPACFADPKLLMQVLLNLINNAAEALKVSGSERRIAVSSSMEDNWVRIGVSDSGPGVPKGMMKKIFDPFFHHKELRIGHRAYDQPPHRNRSWGVPESFTRSVGRSPIPHRTPN